MYIHLSIHLCRGVRGERDGDGREKKELSLFHGLTRHLVEVVGDCSVALLEL